MATTELKNYGAKHVIITLGSEGLVYSGDFVKFLSQSKALLLTLLGAETVSTELWHP